MECVDDDKAPSTWELSAGKSFRFLVSNKSDEYKSIVDEFSRAMKGKLKNVIKIERIQNERWYFQYLAHKKDFFKRLKINSEQRLYHGCPQNVVNSIIEDCFNRSFAGVNG
jgi:CRISPR/Cas system CMR subunit Cmr6 (Cas7 group RAMP superfamily)